MALPVFITCPDPDEEEFVRETLNETLLSELSEIRMFENPQTLLRFLETGDRSRKCGGVIIFAFPLSPSLTAARRIQSFSPECDIILTLEPEEEAEALPTLIRSGIYGWLRPLRKAELASLTRSLIKARGRRHQARTAVREKESYLRTIMETVQSAVMVIDPESYRIIEANPCAARLLGCAEEKLIGRDFYELRDPDTDSTDPAQRMVSDEYTLLTDAGTPIHVRRSLATARVRGREYLVQSMLDITDIRQLMKKQEISIDLAKHLLAMINGIPSRHTRLPGNAVLFSEALSFPCHREGGDHFFIRNKGAASRGDEGKTVISLKDQSGHEVGCVLRSIITDLIHVSLLSRMETAPPASVMERLNSAVCRSDIFQPQDFFTAVTAEIDRGTLEMHYVSNGHPRFILIREDRIEGLPERGGAGRHFMIPMETESHFTAGVRRLRKGDRLIFYTDGLLEMPRAARKKVLGFEDLADLIRTFLRENPRMPVSVIVERLLESVAGISGVELRPFSLNTSLDDVTVIGVEIEEAEKMQEKRLRPKSASAMYEMMDHFFEELMDQLQDAGFIKSALCVRSILAEAVLNAWRHGNREHPEKTVTIRWRFGNDLYLEVADEGEGFDSEGTPDPRTDGNILRTSGRGIYIIRKFADTARWLDGGRRVCITLRRNTERTVAAHEARVRKLAQIKETN